MKAVSIEGGLGCPSVGRWEPSIQRGAQLREGVLLGRLVRLGRRHELRAPSTGGQVVDVSPAGWLAYGDALLSVGVLEGESLVEEVSAESAEGLVAIRAPMAGTIYQRPSPGDPAFVEIGARVERLETLALMEVMKTFTPIKADPAGVLERWGVDDGGSVDSDGVIAWIRPG